LHPLIPFVQLWFIVAQANCAASHAAYLISIAVPDSEALMVSVIYIALMSSLTRATPSIDCLKQSFRDIKATASTLSSFFRWIVESHYLVVLQTYKHTYDISWGLLVNAYALLAPIYRRV
jgi:hypothetical protein